MSCVISKSDWRTIGGTQPAHGANDQELAAIHLTGFPAHGGVLRPSEQVSAGSIAEEDIRERQRTGRSCGLRWDVVELGLVGPQFGD